MGLYIFVHFIKKKVLGRLALKYPNLAKISVRHLTDFLTEPSPILLKQYKHIIDKLTLKSDGENNRKSNHAKSMSVNVNNRQMNGDLNGTYRSLGRNQTLSKYDTVSYSKSTRIFEFIRDLTIECLCL